MKYTYPQVQELLAQCNKYIRFEVEVTTAPIKAIMGMFGGGGGEASSATAEDDDSDYTEATEDSLNMLARALGG